MGAWIIDGLIAFTVVEAALLCGWHRSGRGGVAPADLLPNMASGLCLMLSLRMALAGASWHWIALGVTGSGLAHAFDLRRRWKHRLRPHDAVLKSRSPTSRVQTP